MLARLRAWRAERRRRDEAIRRAVKAFREIRGFAPMGSHVLRVDPEQTIVRVMYMTNRKPPDRAWFAVSQTDAGIRELTFDDVAHLETPWR
jgi:hypothetical protein